MNSKAVVESGTRGESSPSGPLSSSELLALVRAATLAPSPDNNQPWRFRCNEGKLLVYEDPARRLPSDVCSMFSLLAQGAAVENVVIAATQHGLAAEVTLARGQIGDGSSRPHPNTLPEGEGAMPAAEVQFSPGAEPDRLAAVLEVRCTNRHPFSREAIAAGILDRMTASVARFDGCRVTWLTDRAAIRRLSKLVGIADRMRFERAEFHAELYRQLRLTPDDAERTRDGLDLRTLGLPPGGDLTLKALKSWPLVRFLNRFGLSRMLTGPSAGLARQSGAIGVLTTATAAPESFFAAGRALERLWLTAADLGLSFHPLGSLPIFVGHYELLGGRALDERHAQIAAVLSQRFRDVLPTIAGQIPVMVFRVGACKTKPVRSLRRAVEDMIDRVPNQPHAEDFP